MAVVIIHVVLSFGFGQLQGCSPAGECEGGLAWGVDEEDEV